MMYACLQCNVVFRGDKDSCPHCGGKIEQV